MTNLDELLEIVDTLPEGDRERARVLLFALLQGGARGDQHPADDAALGAWLERVDANPTARARLNAQIQVGLDDAAAGRVVDGPTAMAAIRARLNLPEIGE